jgi:hypothetical protein
MQVSVSEKAVARKKNGMEEIFPACIRPGRNVLK